MATKAQKNYEAFLSFHQQNPKVWTLFEKFTLDRIAKGFKNYSAYAIMQRVRWETDVVTEGDIFKINNNHIPYYARMFHTNHTDRSEFFRLRELTTTKKTA